MKRMDAAAMVVALITAGLAGSAAAKSPQACRDEYRANAAKIAGQQTQDQFLEACARGEAVVSGATSASRPAVPPAVAAQQPATPAKAAGEASKAGTTP